MPDFSSTDGGVKHRVRMQPFESKYVDNVQGEHWKDLKHVFACDYKLKTLFIEFGPSMMRKLIEWFPIYIEEGIAIGTNATPEHILVNMKTC